MYSEYKLQLTEKFQRKVRGLHKECSVAKVADRFTAEVVAEKKIHF